jgi:glutamine synthetase
MCAIANPGSCGGDAFEQSSRKQTVEIRSADGSANVYLLIAGLAVACRHGFEIADALEIAEKNYVDVDIHKPENAAKLKGLKQLPTSCEESAKCLDAKRELFEAKGVFPSRAIDGVISCLTNFDEAKIMTEAKNNPKKMEELVARFFHCG